MKKGGKIALILAAIAVLVAVCLVIVFVAVPNSKYERAEKLLAAGQYQAAAQAFTDLVPYKDSADRVNQTYYAQAEALLEAGRYQAAADAFEALIPYSDSADRIDEVWYAEAEELFEKGKFIEAAEAFEALIPYSDTADRKNAALYAEAEQLFENGKLTEAAEAFKVLIPYADTADRVKAVNYAQAEALLADGETYAAVQAFRALGGYSDAAARTSDIWAALSGRDTLSAGYYFALAVKNDGTVLAERINSHGSDYVERENYGQCNVDDWTDIVSVSAGIYHSLGLRADGTVLAAGDDDYGKCNVSSWRDVVAVSAGEEHSVGLRADGTVLAVGCNDEGQCEVNNWRDIVAVSAGSYHTLGLKADGTVVAAGGDWCYDVISWTDVIAISAGESFSVGLRADGTVLVSGDYDSRVPSRWRDIVAVDAFENYGGCGIVGLRRDGTAVLYIEGEETELPFFDIVDISVCVYNYYNYPDVYLALRADGTVIDLDNEYYYMNVYDWADIKLPAISPEHKQALEAKTAEMDAKYGPDYAAVEAAMAEGDYQTAFDKLIGSIESGLAECSYRDSWLKLFECYYKLAEQELEQDDFESALDIFEILAEHGYTDSARRINDVHYAEALSIMDSGDYFAAIDAFEALEGYMDSAEKIEECKAALYAAAEEDFAAGRYEEAGLTFKSLSEMDYSDSLQRYREVVYAEGERMLANGEYETAVEIFEILAEYGYSDSAQRINDVHYAEALAIMDSGDYFAAIAVFEALEGYMDSAEKIGECKAALYAEAEALLDAGDNTAAAYAFAALGDYSDAPERAKECWGVRANLSTIDAGWYHTVAVKTDGTVLAAGLNLYGQCNVRNWTDIISVSAGRWHTVGVRTDGTVVATGENEDGQCAVDSWSDIVAVAAGQSHTLGLRADGTVVATGWNEHGQCNVSGWTDIVAVSAGAVHSVGLRADGTVVAAGKNNYGQCNVKGWSDVVFVNADNWGTVAITADGRILASGSKEGGNLAVDKWTDIIAASNGYWHTVGLKADGTVVAVGGEDTRCRNVGGWTDIVAVSTGDDFTVGLRADGTVVAVGVNSDGQCNVSGWSDIRINPAPRFVGAPVPDVAPAVTLPLRSGLVGISMPTKDLHRWYWDGEHMKVQLETLGYDVNLQYAANDIQTQVSQIENMIANGCEALIIAAIDGEALGPVLTIAKEAGIPVISYDRLIMNSDAVTCYVTFDNWDVGVKQGQYIVDALDLANAGAKTYNIEFITGDPGDKNINFFFDGAMSVLQPYLDAGVLVCTSGQTDKMDAATANWSTDAAQARFESILHTFYADGTQLDAVLCSNDSTALGVENALAALYTGEYPVITGQDCDVANVINMTRGLQSMSVFKDTGTLAAKAVEIADALIFGAEPPINDTETYDNGTGVIPSFLCEPVVCTPDMIQELLIDSGYYTAGQLEM